MSQSNSEAIAPIVPMTKINPSTFIVSQSIGLLDFLP